MKTTVRLANESDAQNFVGWQTGTRLNLFDPAIATYPSLRTLAVDIDGSPVSYVPFHPVMAVESIGHKPDLTPRENAYALRKVQDALEDVARTYGMAEIWWQCSDPTLIEFAKRHGYEVLTSAVTLRKKVNAQ
jgi:hypothetical protein